MQKKIVSLIGLFLISLAVYSQSSTLASFEKLNEESGYNLYLYQSVIRMLNKDNNDDFNKLIEDLDFVKVIISDSTGVSSTNRYNSLVTSIQSEGFEELLMIDNKDMKACIYEKEGKSGEAELVAFVHSALIGRIGAFEMKGQLDMNYISSFESLDFNKLKKLAEDQY